MNTLFVQRTAKNTVSIEVKTAWKYQIRKGE